MAADKVRAVARKLVVFHERFADEFGRREAREHSLVYLKGLILADGRKSVERIALRFATGDEGQPATQNEVVALQDFLTCSPWDYGGVQRTVQAVFAEELVPSTAEWPLGTVGVVDESGFVKNGSESCGVKRQWCGRLGKKENCQVGVFLVGVTPAGSALLDHQLYLPEEWAADRRQRRKKTRVPEEIEFQTKPQIAAHLIRRTRSAGHVRFDWITADEGYGHCGEFLDDLEAQNQRYVVEVPVTTTVHLAGPDQPVSVGSDQEFRSVELDVERTWSVQAVVARLPADAWHQYQLREGAKGPLVFDFAFVRVWAVRHGKLGPAQWLLARRSLAAEPEIKYYVSNADGHTPTEHLALVTGTRWRVEEFFEDGKGDFGMADYEARSWTSWHHHMALVAVAHLFITVNRKEMQPQIPELTLPMALQLIQAALERPHLTPDEAIRLTEYHLVRNRTARDSHRKSWHRRHKRANPKRLL